MGSWSRVTDHPSLGQEGSGQCCHPHVTQDPNSSLRSVTSVLSPPPNKLLFPFITSSLTKRWPGLLPMLCPHCWTSLVLHWEPSDARTSVQLPESPMSYHLVSRSSQPRESRACGARNEGPEQTKYLLVPQKKSQDSVPLRILNVCHSAN